MLLLLINYGQDQGQVNLLKFYFSWKVADWLEKTDEVGTVAHPISEVWNKIKEYKISVYAYMIVQNIIIRSYKKCIEYNIIRENIIK